MSNGQFEGSNQKEEDKLRSFVDELDAELKLLSHFSWAYYFNFVVS